MKKYFEVKVKYSKIDEQTGKEKIVCEPYLVDAMSFTEAEAIITTKMSEIIHTEFIIHAIKKSNFVEIIRSNEDFDKWFSFVVAFATIDERAGKEKVTNNLFLVNNDTLEAAKEQIMEYLTCGSFEYKIDAIKETKIVEVYDYES